MACSNPLRAFKCADGSTVWNEADGDVVTSRAFGCGQCALCRRAKALDRKTRLVDESYCHADSICATFTVAPEHLDSLGGLPGWRRVAELFIQRLQMRLLRKHGIHLRYDLIAEYSPELRRPHFHAALFGWLPADAVPSHRSQSGNQEFTSEELSDAWGLGRTTFQVFTPAAASYMAGHQAWKLGGQLAFEMLGVRDLAGRLLGQLEPEFRLASRRPGMGGPFFDKHRAQLLALGFSVLDGVRVPVPEYYLKRAERTDPGRVSELRAERELVAAGLHAANPLESSDARLAVREFCARALANRVSRSRSVGNDA